jgi:cholesterol oxidase
MKGFFSLGADDFEQGWDAGKTNDSPFEFTLTIISDDLDSMLENEEHKARIVGTVVAPALSDQPLTVNNGEFNLFVREPGTKHARRMRYRMHLTAENGKSYFFDGFKMVRDDFGLDMWGDTTTLFITVFDGDNSEAPVLGKGILKIHPVDFAKQMTTMQITNATSAAQMLGANARFGQFFAGALFDTYGGIATKPQSPSRVYEVTPRKKRPLRAGVPEVYALRAGDGEMLRLTRYKGGDKGPVILSHGLGVSSLIFSTDTIETNMLEYLYEHDYDVWLLDHRASIDLPVSAKQYSADDVAEHDYPAAVDTVQRLTGAESVQMVAHCYGSTTFTMAMLRGLKGVRSAVCSQIGMHVIPPAATRLKTGLHLPTFLKALGVESLTAYAGDDPDWRDSLYDTALKVFPIEEEERCINGTCRRITFMYGPLYEHDQLSAGSHEAIHELFGMACMKAFSHLAAMARSGHVVDEEGRNRYTPFVERLGIPITYIHGAENQCFLPISTEMTYNLLRERNGHDLYARHIIPGYGHIDCIFGKNAARDVYPYIVRHLEATL